MIIKLVDAFKKAYGLTDKKIADAIGVSPSTLEKHRHDPDLRLSDNSAGQICGYVLIQIENVFPEMNPEKRLFLLQALMDHSEHFTSEVHQLQVRGATKRAIKKYLTDQEDIPPNWR